MKKYLVEKVSTSTNHEKLGNIVTFDTIAFEEEFGDVEYGRFDTIEEARECFNQHKDEFWYRSYKTPTKTYECHIEYVKLVEVEYDAEEDEITEWGDIWEMTFQDFEVKE